LRIAPFSVEQWMNAHEESARWNIAETCVDSLQLRELLDLAPDSAAALESLLNTQLTYGHIQGSPELRAAVAAQYGATVSAENVLTASGAIAANFLLHFSLVEPGDVIVCVHPTYQQLYSIPESFGAEVRLLHLTPKQSFLPDLDRLRALTTDGPVKLIVINNPNNPSGALMDEATLEAIVEIAQDCGAYLHADEVYRGLAHEPGMQPPSVVDLYDRAISVGSMSKAYSLAGLRLGWIVGPREVLAACEQHRDYTTISCGVIDDRLATVALANADSLEQRNLRIVRNNAGVLHDWIESEPRLSYVPPKAGTTVLVKYDYDLPSFEFSSRMLTETGAFVVPGACFDFEGWVRIGYACASETLKNGLAAFSAFLRTLETSLH